MVLLAVAVRAVDHHRLAQAFRARAVAQTSRDVLGVVVRARCACRRAGSRGRCRCRSSGRSPTRPAWSPTETSAASAPPAPRRPRSCVLPSVLFLKPTGIDRPDASSRCTWLSVVRAPIATHDVRSAMCCGICVSRNSDAGRQPEVVDVEQQLARQPQPLVDVKALVEVRIVDEPLPADRGARLLEVGAHHDDQLVGVALGERLSAARRSRAPPSCRESSTGPTTTTSRGIAAAASTLAIADRAFETTLEARSLIGISSSRIAGGMSGRTCVMRRSSVRWNMSPTD